MTRGPAAMARELAAAIVLALAAAGAARAADDGDACSRLIPDSLVRAVQASFPNFRAPLAADNLPDDVAANLKARGSGCLGAASADLDGDAVPDFVLGLAPLTQRTPLAVIALARGSQWVFQPINAQVGTRERLYVDVVPPGRYDRSEALEPPLPGSDDKRQVTCVNHGVVVGATRATGIVYCLVRGSWWRVVVSG